MRKRFQTFFLFLLIGMLSSINAWSTHLRAGEITIRRKNCAELTFIITITVYTNTGSQIRFGDGILDFGDGTTMITPTIENTQRPDLGPNIGIVTFTTEHTYSGPGRFEIGYLEPNRNAGILNMFNSVETRFYIESSINIDPFLGCDDSPRLLVPPIDKACSGAAWFHNPGAFDPNGDSLSYELTIPKRDKGIAVNNYRDPNVKEFYDKVGINYNTANEDGNGPPTFAIDALTGTLIWDSPGSPGEYNIAFIVRSWRKIADTWINQGYVIRDMQIIVEDCLNERPELQVPPDICVEAGQTVTADIFGTDPDFDDVQIEAFSQILNPPFPSPATYTPLAPHLQHTNLGPAKITFTWTTNCLHVKDQPYQVVFKITDNPPPGKGAKLVEFKTWNIRVVGPPPKFNDLIVQPTTRRATLKWNNYACSNAELMQVWRRVEQFPFTPAQCQTGMPAFLGFTKIIELPINERTYIDTNDGLGLAPGAQYCYRLVAIFPFPAGGESYVSKDTCFTMPSNAPIITNVTVDKTGTVDGVIQVKWQKPDPAVIPPPYFYRVYRAEGLKGDLKLTSLNTTPLLENDTTFLDSGINTAETIFNYRVDLTTSTGDKITTSAIASAVRLDAKPQFQRIELNWVAEVPWTNQSSKYPNHLIYRGPEGANESQMVLIDSINVTNGKFVYVDSGQFNGVPLSEEIVYCYRIMTRGSYGNPKIKEPLLNFSEINCAQPNDQVAPCKQEMSIVAKPCSEYYSTEPCDPQVFTNVVTWKRSPDEECRKDIRSYRIYVASFKGSDFSLYTEDVRDTFFIDANLPSYARCYRISAVDRAGNESELSEEYCFDNCPYYEMPNVFTPNGDNCNEVFSAFSDRQFIDENGNGPCGPVDLINQRMHCARFVEKVIFTVNNRWGRTVYTYESGGERSIYVDWDGRDNNGTELPTAVYYFNAEVTFTVVDPSQKVRNIRGWVQLIR